MFNFCVGLTTKNKKEIHSRLLSRIENDTNITLNQVTEECLKMINIKWDNKSIENKEAAQIQRVKKTKQVRRKIKNYCKIFSGRTHTTSISKIDGAMCWSTYIHKRPNIGNA